MVECSPATRATRVRFPADAAFCNGVGHGTMPSVCVLLVLICLMLGEKNDSFELGRRTRWAQSCRKKNEGGSTSVGDMKSPASSVGRAWDF